MMRVNSITLVWQGRLGDVETLKYSWVIIMKAEYKNLYEKIGLNVVYYRKRKRLTQLQLAELVDIDRSHISAIELGNVGMSLDVVFKMSEVLEIEPKALFDFR